MLITSLSKSSYFGPCPISSPVLFRALSYFEHCPISSPVLFRPLSYFEPCPYIKFQLVSKKNRKYMSCSFPQTQIVYKIFIKNYLSLYECGLILAWYVSMSVVSNFKYIFFTVVQSRSYWFSWKDGVASNDWWFNGIPDAKK